MLDGNGDEECCAYCGGVGELEVGEDEYEFMEGRESFPLFFCGEGCLECYIRINYGEHDIIA